MAIPNDLQQLLVTASGGAKLRDHSTCDFGRERVEGNCAVVVPVDEAQDVVMQVRRSLPKGYVVWAGTQRWLGQEKLDGKSEIAIAPGQSQFDILRAAKSDAINFGKETEHLVKELKAWDEEFGIEIWHAETDTIELMLKQVPDDVEAFAQRVYEFCPDIVDQGDGDVGHLAETIAETKAVYLWWD
jgi:hypothetical protein